MSIKTLAAARVFVFLNRHPTSRRLFRNYKDKFYALYEIENFFWHLGQRNNRQVIYGDIYETCNDDPFSVACPCSL